MNFKLQKCTFCHEERDVVMTSSRSIYIKICLDCYLDLDKKNQKNFGSPTIKRNTGTHHTK